MPQLSGTQLSVTKMSKDTVVTLSMVADGAKGSASTIPVIKLTTFRCSTTTPFGVPVVPEV
ncbi:hypothetical protein ASF12_33145 [Paenibacillus sp. Leaf72]|nr:hypothetical protein ASF12_33145 [Paenibacillus sp. Leaf72]